MGARYNNLAKLAGAALVLVFAGVAAVPRIGALAQGAWQQQMPPQQSGQPAQPFVQPQPYGQPYTQQIPQQPYQQQPQYPQQVPYPQQQQQTFQQPAYPQPQPSAQQPAYQPSPPGVQQAPQQIGAPTATPAVAQQPTGVAQQPTGTLQDVPIERVEADVSTRSVAVTSSFTGTEIVIFGSVDNSRQPTAESGLYDIAIIIEGTPTPIIARKKSRVGGLWINTQSQTFDDVPSYYAIASTRPIEEIGDAHALAENEIGFDYVNMVPKSGEKSPKTAELSDFRAAVVRRKQGDNLYQKSDYGVAFIGRSLFRSTITLPANVPVGPLVTRVYLFKEGKLLGKHSSRVNLQREGIERYLHDFAFDYPLFYGIFAVLTAVIAGLVASALFKKGSH